MRRFLQCCTVFVLLLPLALAGSLSERDRISEARRACLERLRSASAEDAANAVLQLRAERSFTIDSLLRLAADKSQEIHIEYARGDAIKLLGEYRAEEAISFLVAHVLDCPPGTGIREFDPLAAFPAANALIQIGDRAIREIVGPRMDRPISDKELKVLAWIIRLHYTPMHEEEVGLYRMRRLLQEEKGKREAYSKQRGVAFRESPRQQNLARLIETYERISLANPADWPRP